MVARGLAVAAFDGPGQGMLSFDSKLRPDLEVAVQAIISALAGRPDVDGSRLAVGGISYGGMFAVRTAAVDDRVRAVFAISSWYTPAGRFAEMDDLTRPGQYQHHGPDPAANMAAMTLAGAAARARVPLLQVYGGNDPGSPPAHGERIAAEYGGPVTTVIYPDGVHILNNLWYQARPLVADWLAETL
jgi:2,6-dihydroxypseudooxynicotine hydrolase